MHQTQYWKIYNSKYKCQKNNHKRLYFNNQNSRFYFTRRESECAYWLIKKYPNKMIANELKIGIRTVEAYMDMLRIKTGTSNRRSHRFSNKN